MFSDSSTCKYVLAKLPDKYFPNQFTFSGKMEGEGGGVFEISNSKCLKTLEMHCSS